MSLALVAFFVNINNKGVDPVKYSAFTNSIGSVDLNISSKAASAYNSVITVGSRSLYVLFTFFVMLVTVIIILFLYIFDCISIIFCIAGLVLTLAVFGLFYIILDFFIRKANSQAAQEFGSGASDSILYTFTSVFRDLLYLTLLR